MEIQTADNDIVDNVESQTLGIIMILLNIQIQWIISSKLPIQILPV